MKTTVTWMLPDKLGGVNNFVANILGHRVRDDLEYHAVLARNLSDPDDPSDGDIAAEIKRVSYRFPSENVHSVLRRIARLITAGRGAIVANDWMSLAVASGQNTGKAVVYINHGDFDHYYDLALMHEPTIDVYITYTQRMFDHLRELLPKRADQILLIPYGVEVPPPITRAESDKVRLLYVGRLDRSKGVLDLPAIDAAVRDSGIQTQWTIQGPGPAEAELRSAWGEAPHVTWNGRTTMERVKEQYRTHDILVMPSRAEGLPVALLEGMAAGCVPVVSDLPSGIPEIVENGVSGFRIPPGDIEGFAQAIISVAGNSNALRTMGAEATARIKARFDIAKQAPEYQRAIAAAADLTPRWRRPLIFTGSRLDQRWLPNFIVRQARSLQRTIQRKSRGG
ncbi:MAG TPA: glycosyltransferase family 4 protein [Gemmatimonadaceae bacterium]|nr:glycosyltransferase family 4 protein [Gemmatimonadaceae bacterium]